MGNSTAPGRNVSKPTAAYWLYLRRLCAFCNACAQQVRHAARKAKLDIAGHTSQLFYMAASRLMCVSRVALPEKPRKVSFVCRAVLHCNGCGLAVWSYITGHLKTVLYGEYSTGCAFESPTQSTIIFSYNRIPMVDMTIKLCPSTNHITSTYTTELHVCKQQHTPTVI